ncbi:hypothetical protein [uncultured Thiohalocapsa sp.]|uniref:hypothetical protein n=1 Tax=uncultured Thiohalocapsa sp. TaxID=768990 RepID=UPI0025F7BCCE|nr:hypothetical protein [uncultured Thiohalocapsa sp.]
MMRLPLACAVLALAAAPVHADAITDQIDAAERAYVAGDEQVAIQALEFAIAQIKEQLRARQLALLPAPLPGWSADDPVSDAGGIAAMFTGTTLTRTYRNDAGASVTIGITADSPLLSMLTTLMQASPGATPYTHAGYRGVLELHQDGTSRLLLLVGTRIQVQVEGSGVERQTLEAYLRAVPLAQLEEALLG